MKYFKRSERIVKAMVLNAGIKSVGGIVKEVAEYSKWHEQDTGSRIQVKMFVIKADFGKVNGTVGYYLKDGMGMVASDIVTDINDIKCWLDDHGYKTIHDWYVQDCGMSEKTWKEWNKSND